jgi:hypothetical protein
LRIEWIIFAFLVYASALTLPAFWKSVLDVEGSPLRNARLSPFKLGA